MGSGGKPDLSGKVERGIRAKPFVLIMFAVVAWAGAADAHKKQVAKARELVRIQGHRGSQPLEVPVVLTIELLVLGQRQPFQATTWSEFRLDDAAEPPPEAATHYTLQGDRATLRRFSKARPEQLVTILAERRPGSRDLFVVALDLCPPD